MVHTAVERKVHPISAGHNQSLESFRSLGCERDEPWNSMPGIEEPIDSYDRGTAPRCLDDPGGLEVPEQVARRLLSTADTAALKLSPYIPRVEPVLAGRSIRVREKGLDDLGQPMVRYEETRPHQKAGIRARVTACSMHLRVDGAPCGVVVEQAVCEASVRAMQLVESRLGIVKRCTPDDPSKRNDDVPDLVLASEGALHRADGHDIRGYGIRAPR